MNTRSRHFAYRVRSIEDGYKGCLAVALCYGAEVYEEKQDCIFYHILVRFDKPLTITQARNKLARIGDPSFCTVKKPDEYRGWAKKIGKRVFVL